jgi:hypothetical protein
METMQVCPECGAAWDEEQTCQDHFHQMILWEYEKPANRVVHHLMVLSYHLQHPSLYSPQGLSGAMHLLADFLEHGVTPGEARKQHRATVDSSTRTWKIKGTPASHGVYDHPLRWTLTASDVIEGGVDNYCESVRTWARSIHDDLTTSGNLSSE